MAIKHYNVTLEEEVVNDAKAKMKPRGEKLSPIINWLLKAWNKDKLTVEEF